MSGPRRRKFVGPIVSRVTWHGGRGTPYLRRWALLIALAAEPGVPEVELGRGLKASQVLAHHVEQEVVAELHAADVLVEDHLHPVDQRPALLHVGLARQV